jgi:proline-specific peptidase
MSEPSMKEGTIPFNVPGAGKLCSTWYKVFGNLDDGTPPLILLHGGPGACHEYLLPFADITSQYSIPTIFYDQIGNGQSTRLPEKMGDTNFWTVQLFHDELDNLIDSLGIRERGFNILGQSWGGMMGSSFATKRPKGLQHLIIANSPASMELWVESGRGLLDVMPDVRDTINHYEGKGEYDNQDYKKAIATLYAKHLCNVEPWPAPEVKAAMDHLEEDTTVYMTM